jgi:tRNA threonylcarbamoyladenosine dehydratase
LVSLGATAETCSASILQDFQVLPNFRIRTLPVFGALPAIFGLSCAAHVISTLTGQVLSSDPILHIHTKQYKTQFERLRDREASRGSMKSWVNVELQARVLTFFNIS